MDDERHENAFFYGIKVGLFKVGRREELMSKAPKFLFVPVSSEEGIGEYMRSKILADEVVSRWPDAEIEFVLNSYAPYSQQCPYTTHLVNDTPTKRVKEVNALITAFRPDVVIFDAAGRKAQLRHAHKCGAKVIFISQHKRKRSRGMKVERALVTDSHWVVQPEFVIGDISQFDKLKLNLIKRAFPIFTGSIFTQPSSLVQQGLYTKYGVMPKQYLLYSAGSGGHNLKNQLAADLFAQVAQAIFNQTGIPSLMVFGPNYPNALPQLDGVTVIEQLSSVDFINLLDSAQGAILSGGDTLLQAIALKVPTLAVAVSKDQPSRIKQCVNEGLVLHCESEIDVMVSQVTQLLQPSSSEQLRNKMESVGETKGLDICMAEVARLLDAAPCQ